MRELRDHAGVSVLIYDQTCATEKRRRRKRGAYPDRAARAHQRARVRGLRRLFGAVPLLSVEPLETEFGRKRAINQSSCNKDFSCLKGFCPSFVTVEGGKLRKPQPLAPEGAIDDSAGAGGAGLAPGVFIAGVGGTGVVTIGQLLGMAAHIEGRGCSVLDMAGLAQKGRRCVFARGAGRRAGSADEHTLAMQVAANQAFAWGRRAAQDLAG